MKTGDRVLYVVTGADPYDSRVCAGVLTSYDRSECVVKFEDGVVRHLYSAFVFPDLPECREHLQNGIDMRRAHKDDETEHSKATYALLNDLTRRGLR